jgi:hypothetical protein
VSAALISFGIQAIVRLGRVGNDALEQWVRDGEAVFPFIRQANFDPRIFVAGFFNANENQHFVNGTGAPFAEHWNGNTPRVDSTSVDALFTAAVKITAERGGDVRSTFTPAAAVMVRQWESSSRPLSPWARILLTAADIVLDYVSVNPAVLGGEGNGEKLIAAYAANLAELLPDDGNFGPREQFLQRLAAAFLRAGLSTAIQQPDLLLSEEHVTRLIGATLAPLADAFPASVNERLRWSLVSEALMGPAASAAFTVVAEHQTAFLGKDFTVDSALGAVTRALFLEAAKDGLKDRFTKEGLLGLYSSVLGVAADRPELFIGPSSSEKEEFVRAIFSRFMDVLRNSPPPFDAEVGIQLASAALEAVGHHVHRFVDESDWETVAADLVVALTGRLSEALNTNQGLRGVLSKDQLMEIGRILLNRIAETPRMILGSGHEAWEGVLRAVAAAMVADRALLLDGDDWLEIVSVAATEAAANPGRLFALDPNDPDDVLAGKLITVVLRAAGQVLQTPNRKARTVLYGATLREAITIVLHATAGKPADARGRIEQLELLVRELTEFVADHGERYGSKEWLRSFRSLLTRMLEGQETPELTTSIVDGLLQGDQP